MLNSDAPLGRDASRSQLHDLEWVRHHEFPLTSSWSYLNHAGTGPLPTSHVRAACEFLTAMSATKPPTTLLESAIKEDEVRTLGATLLDCQPEDIAILCNTTQALGLVPSGLDWHEGDEVILYEREFPNVVFPWLHLRSSGVRIRIIPDRGNRFELADLLALINERTRVIALSLVQFASGFRAPIEEIGRICAQRDIWLLVDAIQGVGVIPVYPKVLGADVLAASGYKHLLSGYGVALCYCSDRARAMLRIPSPGWQGTQTYTDAGNLLDYEGAVFTPDARRFEPTVPNFSGLWGTVESLRLLAGVGISHIQAHVTGLLDELIDVLRSRHYTINSPMNASERSTLLSVSPAVSVDNDVLAQRFLDNKVAVSIREGAIRISPHFYNTPGDIERLLAVLP